MLSLPYLLTLVRSPISLQDAQYWESPIDLNSELERLFHDPVGLAPGFTWDNADCTCETVEDGSRNHASLNPGSLDEYKDSFGDPIEFSNYLSKSCSPHLLGFSDGQEFTLKGEPWGSASGTYTPESSVHHLTPGESISQASSPQRQSSGARNKIIKEWFMKNLSSPYPSKDQLQSLAAASGLSGRQTRVSLSNLRSRMRAGKSEVKI